MLTIRADAGESAGVAVIGQAGDDADLSCVDVDCFERLAVEVDEFVGDGIE